MNLNDKSKELEVSTTSIDDGNIYHLRRQIDQNDATKQFIRLEIQRYETLLQEITNKNTSLWITL